MVKFIKSIAFTTLLVVATPFLFVYYLIERRRVRALIAKRKYMCFKTIEERDAFDARLLERYRKVFL